MSKKLELKLLLDMVDKVTGPLKKIREASGGVSGELKATRDKLKELNKQSAQIDGFKKQQKAMQSTASTLVDAQAKVKQMQAQMKALGGEASNKMRTDFRKANEAVRDLSRTLEKQRTGLGEHRQKLRDSGIDTGKLGDAQKDLKEKIQQTTDVMELQRKKLDAVSRKQKRLNDAGANYQKAKALQGDLAGKGAGMVATGAAIGAASAVPIIEYSKAETAATGLKVSMMGAGGVVRKEFAEINALATQLGNKLPGTTADFQDMMTTLIQQGMSSKAILGGLGEATAFLGVQMKLPFNEAAEFAAKLQDATGTAEKDMMNLMDVIQRSYYLGVDKTNMLQGFSKLSSALPVLRKQGLEAAQLLSPLIVMADQAGMAGEASGNAYRKAFQLSMDTGKVGKANNILADMGIKLDFTDGKGEFAGLENMFSQLQKLGGLNTETRLSVLKQIYGDDAETLQVMNIMITKGIAGYRETAAKMEAQASLQLRVNEQLNTLTNLWDAATGTFTNALVNVGEAVAPELKQLVNWLGEMAEKLGTWIKANPELTGTLFKVAMGVGALAVAGGTLTLMLAGILGPLAMIKYSAEILGIKSLPLVGSAITKLGGAFSWILGGLKTLSIALFTTPIGWLILGITALIGAGYLLVTHWDTVKAWMSDFWQTIKSLAGEGIEAVKSYFNGLPEPIKAVLSGIWGTMKTVFSWSPIGLIVNNFDDIVSFFTGLPAKFSSLGEMTMDGLVKGITGKLAEVKETITNAATDAIGWFKDVLGIASPSKVFAVMGDQTMQGLTVGINRSQQEPLNEINKLSKQMAGTAFVLGISALPAAAMPNDVANLLSPAPIIQNREIIEQLSPAKLSQPEDAVRQVRDEHSAAVLPAVPAMNREIVEQIEPPESSAMGYEVLSQAVDALMPSLTDLMPSLAQVRRAFTHLRTMMSTASGTLMRVGQTLLFVGRAAALNPIGLLVTAIGLGALAVYKYWQPVKAFFVGFWQGLQEGLAPVAEALGPAFTALGSALMPLKPIWDGIASVLGTVWKWVTDLLTPINATATELDNATGAGTRFGLWLADLVTLIPNVIGNFVGFGASIMSGISDGIMSRVSAVKESLGGAINGSIDYIKDLLGIASPSKVFAVMGDQTMQGLTVGINRSQQAPLNEVGKLGKQMAGAAFVLGVTALPAAAITDQTRIIRDEYQSADYSVPDAIRLVKEGELPARKQKNDDLSPDDNSLAHNTAPDRLGAFAQRQAPQPQTVHIDAGIHAPITVYATANMNAQDVAQLIAIELEKRERAQQARLRSSLKDLN